MTKMAVADFLQKGEIAYFEPDGHIEVRSWWRHLCTAVEQKDTVSHSCNTESEPAEITLHAFPTIYGRYWKIGGCTDCRRIFYHALPLTLHAEELTAVNR